MEKKKTGFTQEFFPRLDQGGFSLLTQGYGDYISLNRQAFLRGFQRLNLPGMYKLALLLDFWQTRLCFKFSRSHYAFLP